MSTIQQKLYIINNGTQIEIPDSYIISLDGGYNTSFEDTNQFTLGLAAPTTSRVKLVKPTSGQFPALTQILERDYNWRMLRIKITSSIDGGVFTTTFDGLFFERSEDTATVSFICRGPLDLINIIKIQTPLLRNRKVATSITDVPNGATNPQIDNLLNQQNPTIASGSSVGIINSILWLAGGRPHKYASLYTEQYTTVSSQFPKFYFDCENSIVNPEWIWFNYENLYSDLSQLCKSSGGVLKQDTDGVVRYSNVYSFRKAWSGFTLTDSNATSFTLGESGTEPYSKVIVTFTPRFLSGSKEIYKQNFSEFIQAGQSVEREIQFSQPVFSLLNKTVSGQLSDSIVNNSFNSVKDFISALDVKGTKRVVYARVQPYSGLYIDKYIATSGIGNFVKAQNTNAVPSQSINLYVVNSGLADSPTLFVADVTLFGRTLEASKTENYIDTINQYPSISGFKQLTIPDNPYIQTKNDAKRVVDLTKYLLENPRQKITANDVPYTSGVSLGDTIYVDSVSTTVSGYFKVTSLNYTRNGAAMNLGLVSVSGLYQSSDFFTIGTAYNDSDTKRLSF
jgi:hypothetical protein